MLDTIKRDATQFVTSSLFRHGDALSFQVPLVPGEISLPGRCSPSDYLTSVGVVNAPRRVLVVGAGNGGLAVECINRGAVQVMMVETRATFAGALAKVQELLIERWKAEDHADGEHRSLDLLARVPDPEVDAGGYDLILWPEALEESKEPPVVLRKAHDLLAPGGRLIVEVLHGKNQWVAKINSWKPTVGAFAEGLMATFGCGWTSKIPGRTENRVIYTITRSLIEGEQAAETQPAPPPPPSVAPAAELVTPGTRLVETARARLEQLVAARKVEEKQQVEPKRDEKGYKCGICDERGHNARTCPAKRAPAKGESIASVVKDELRLTGNDDEPVVVLDADFDADFDAELDQDE